MEVVFGSHLDGMTFPETCNGKPASFHSLVAGPAALIGLLETRLGLRQPPVNRTVRQTEYLKLLQQLQGKHFFSESLKNDAWNTAGHLLSMREELIMSGWKRQHISELNKVNSLAEVEVLGTISDGFPERFVRVAEHLKSHSSTRTPIALLRLVESRESLPIHWRNLISTLEKLGPKVEEIGSVPSLGRGDLLLLQERFSQSITDTSKLHLTADGTFTVLDADDELQAAIVLSTWFSQRGNNEDVLLIRDGDCSALTQACQRNALPSVGSTARSQLKGALQILPLAFQIVRRPINPQILIEFLSIKDGPLPDGIAKQLIAAVNEAPGIGGKSWNAVWKKCTEWYATYLMEQNREIGKAAALQEAANGIPAMQAWFEESVADGANEISRTAAEAICGRIEKWLATKQSSECNKSVFEIAQGHTKMLKQLFNVYDHPSISLDLLQEMIESVTAYGSGGGGGAEAADWSLVEKPGQIWGSAKTIVWWGFAQGAWSFPRRSSWTDLELGILKNHGIVLESLIEKLRRETWSWRMPLLHATERLILVKPRVVLGEQSG